MGTCGAVDAGAICGATASTFPARIPAHAPGILAAGHTFTIMEPIHNRFIICGGWDGFLVAGLAGRARADRGQWHWKNNIKPRKRKSRRRRRRRRKREAAAASRRLSIEEERRRRRDTDFYIQLNSSQHHGVADVRFTVTHFSPLVLVIDFFLFDCRCNYLFDLSDAFFSAALCRAILTAILPGAIPNSSLFLPPPLPPPRVIYLIWPPFVFFCFLLSSQGW